MKIPDSMVDELSAWNDGKGISLQDWAGCRGNFRLAIGYASLFWPSFVQFEDYILTEGFAEADVRAFESQDGASPKSVEWVINHVHIADIQHLGCTDISRDKVIFLGNTLREIFQAKLAWQFPDKPCVVDFYRPDDPDDLMEYQVSFWQSKHSL
jgi:hypothetical protein